MLFAPTAEFGTPAHQHSFVFQETVQPSGGGDAGRGQGTVGAGGGPPPIGPPPSSGFPLPPALLGAAGAVLAGLACICLLLFGAWRLFGFNLRGFAAATLTPVPATSTVPPTLAATLAATNTPSLQDQLDLLPPELAAAARQFLQMGGQPKDLPAFVALFLGDPRLDKIFSISTVPSESYSAFADIVNYFAGTMRMVNNAEEPLFNQSLFECGEHNERTVVCSQDTLPMPSGDLLVASMVLADAIPAPSKQPDPGQPFTIPTGDTMLIYAFVVDSNGNPADNFVPQPRFDWDFYQGTDTWFELVGDPEYGVWKLYVTDTARQPHPSTARAVIEGNTVNFYIGAGEFGDTSLVTYRMSAFVTDGSYAPETSAGDVTGANPQEALLPVVDSGLSLMGPSPDLPQLLLPTVMSATETPPEESTTPVPTGTEAADPEAQARAFISEFSAAQERKDADFLLAHLGQATLDRYGEAQCRSYLETTAGTATAIEVLSTSYPETFDYTTDGVTTTIPDTVLADIQLKALGTPTTGSMHILVEGDQVYWFTDCGSPLN